MGNQGDDQGSTSEIFLDLVEGGANDISRERLFMSIQMEIFEKDAVANEQAENPRPKKLRSPPQSFQPGSAIMDFNRREIRSQQAMVERNEVFSPKGFDLIGRFAVPTIEIDDPAGAGFIPAVASFAMMKNHLAQGELVGIARIEFITGELESGR